MVDVVKNIWSLRDELEITVPVIPCLLILVQHKQLSKAYIFSWKISTQCCTLSRKLFKDSYEEKIESDWKAQLQVGFKPTTFWSCGMCSATNIAIIKNVHVRCSKTYFRLKSCSATLFVCANNRKNSFYNFLNLTVWVSNTVAFVKMHILSSNDIKNCFLKYFSSFFTDEELNQMYSEEV